MLKVLKNKMNLGYIKDMYKYLVSLRIELFIEGYIQIFFNKYLIYYNWLFYGDGSIYLKYLIIIYIIF